MDDGTSSDGKPKKVWVAARLHWAILEQFPADTYLHFCEIRFQGLREQNISPAGHAYCNTGKYKAVNRNPVRCCYDRDQWSELC